MLFDNVAIFICGWLYSTEAVKSLENNSALNVTIFTWMHVFLCERDCKKESEFLIFSVFRCKFLELICISVNMLSEPTYFCAESTITSSIVAANVE